MKLYSKTRKTKFKNKSMEHIGSIIADPVLKVDTDLAVVCSELQMLHKPSTTIGTWRPKDSVTFTMIKTKNDTVLYCHANHCLYIANPWMKLRSECPPKTAFLGHFFIEQDDIPKFLIFDLVDFGCDSVLHRYDKLRQMSSYLPQPICSIQWVGHIDALSQEFLHALPHKVEHIFTLTVENPLVVHTVEQKTL